MQHNHVQINYLLKEITRSSMQSTVITRKHREVAVLYSPDEQSESGGNMSDTKMKLNKK